MNITLQQCSVLLIIILMSLFFAPVTVHPSRHIKALKVPAHQGTSLSWSGLVIFHSGDREVTRDFDKHSKLVGYFNCNTHSETFENKESAVVTDRIESARASTRLSVYIPTTALLADEFLTSRIFEQGGDENV